MIYGYLRVSTTSGEQLSALENQRQRIENAGCDVVLEDIQSGRDNDRPGYLKLLDAIGRGLATKVLVTRLDRLGRDAGEVDGMLAFAAKHRCRVEALDGGLIESESPSGFLLSRVMSSLAEMESRMLSQRIKAGLEVRRTLRAPLRSKSPWGYRKRADGLAFEPDPVEFPRAQQMIRLLQEHSWRFHAALKAWKEQELGPLPINSGLSLSRWLHNPVLRGGVGYHRCSTKNFRETHWDCHTPLIDHGTFESARLQIESNRRRWGKNVRRQAHLLTGLCVCGHCGKRMRYICQDRAPGLYCRGPGCPYAFKDTKEPVIVAGINRALSARAEELGQLVAEESPELAQLRAEVERLQEFHDPDLEEAIQLKLRKMQNLHNLPPVDPELVKSLRQPEFWAVYSEAELRELYLLLVERVVIQDRQVLQVVCRF